MIRTLILMQAASSLIAAADEPGDAQLIDEPVIDRWMYNANFTPGTRAQASTFSALPTTDGVEDRWGFFLIGFDTSSTIPAGLDPSAYQINSIRLSAVTGQDQTFEYDPTPDPRASFGSPSTPASIPDSDPGRPVELHGAGFRNGFTSLTFLENTPYGSPRSAYPLTFDSSGVPRDASWDVTDGLDFRAWSIGTTDTVPPGDSVPIETVFDFEIDPSQSGVANYLKQGLADGSLWFTLTSLHPAIQEGGELASWLTKEDPLHQLFGSGAPQLTIDVSLKLPITFAKSGSTVDLSWPQFAGFTHVLQSSTDLAEWSPLQSNDSANDDIGSYSGTATGSARFYRLQITPSSPD